MGKCEKYKGIKGITLIALVITIINVNDIKSLYFNRGYYYNYIITKDNKLIEISSPSTVIAENVKSFNNNSYINLENELYIYFQAASHDNVPM